MSHEMKSGLTHLTHSNPIPNLHLKPNLNPSLILNLKPNLTVDVVLILSLALKLTRSPHAMLTPALFSSSPQRGRCLGGLSCLPLLLMRRTPWQTIRSTGQPSTRASGAKHSSTKCVTGGHTALQTAWKTWAEVRTL